MKIQVRKDCRGGMPIWLILLIVGIIFATITTFMDAMIDSQQEGLRIAKRPYFSKNFTGFKVIPNIWGGMISIMHRGERRLSPSAIAKLKGTKGVVSVKERDYLIEVRKAPNFEWKEILDELDRLDQKAGT